MGLSKKQMQFANRKETVKALLLKEEMPKIERRVQIACLLSFLSGWFFWEIIHLVIFSAW